MALTIDPQVTQGIRWLQSQSKRIDSGFAAVIRFDTALSEEEAELNRNLSTIYGSDADKYQTDSFLSGRTITVKQYVENDPDSVWSFFQTVRTYVRPEVHHLIDVVSVGILSDSVLRDLESLGRNNENRLRHQIQKSLNVIVKESEVISDPLQGGDLVNPSESPLIFLLGAV